MKATYLKDILSGGACRVSSADEGTVQGIWSTTVNATDIELAFAPRLDERHGFHEGMSGITLNFALRSSIII